MRAIPRSAARAKRKGTAGVTLFLSGDVMLGRGLDQLLAHPGAPELREPHLRDAREYLALVEAREGPLPRAVAPSYLWGDALAELERAAPDVRLVNLETSITTSARFWPDKDIHYRMHPLNLGALTCAGIDACALANNHVLDFGRDGLAETLGTLREARIGTAGAGNNLPEARAPARVPLRTGGAVLLFSAGTECSGIPEDWAASADRSGIDYLPDLSPATADAFAARVQASKGPLDLAIASLHWGSNWGYEVPREQVDFAHRLVDGGVDLIHGHSSHHPRPFEVYRGKLILYGCGDLLSDYEGIGAYESFRSNLRLAYLPRLEAGSGNLLGLELLAFQSHRLSLRRASDEDTRWLAETLSNAGRRFDTRVAPGAGARLRLWPTSENSPLVATGPR